MKCTNEELLILKANYNLSLKELLSLLPNRKINSIKLKRIKLGLTTKDFKIWQDQEIKILKEYGSSLYGHELATMLGRTLDSVLHELKKTIKFMLSTEMK